MEAIGIDKRSSLLYYSSYDRSESLFTTMEVTDIDKLPTLLHCRINYCRESVLYYNGSDWHWQMYKPEILCSL
jgi:hypothetical protein